MIGKIRKESADSYGYDAKLDVYGDLLEFGIVDPVKVVRSALENAVSIAGMVLTTESPRRRHPPRPR